MRRIAVIGASGLVGCALIERLSGRQGADEVVPFIHTSGNAMALARRGVDMRMLDLLDASAVRTALAGVTHVVNCSRGDEAVMLTGVKNLLEASRRCGVVRLVHLSSVAVYGDPPPPESEHEDAATVPVRGSYGWLKLQQDRMVARAAQSGLPAVILCPPNISGPRSYFLVSLVNALRAGTFALLDGGSAPCNLVDVSNLAYAIELGLSEGPADGTRMFVTDDERTSWRAVVEALAPLAERDDPVPHAERDELPGATDAAGERRASLTRSAAHLVSSEVRQALRADPLWEKADTAVRRVVASLGPALENRLRLSVEGPRPVRKIIPGIGYDASLCRQQLRGVWHACNLAKDRLAYRPVYSVAASMSAFSRWYRAHHGMDTASWPLLRQLQ